MQYLVFILALVLVPAMLTLVDRRIKGCRTILGKILSVLFVTTFLYLMIYFHGQTVISLFRINLKSFTNMKAFFSSKIIGLLALLVFILFIACKFVFLRIVFRNFSENVTKEEKIITLSLIVFDLALIPNIFVNGTFFGVFALLSAVELGLVYIKLVFSITYSKQKEVLA